MNMGESIRRLPDSELEVMQALWQADHPLLRSELDEGPGKKNGWAPQVLVTMLTRLEKKGFVCRNKEGRGYRYEALISRDEYLASGCMVASQPDSSRRCNGARVLAQRIFRSWKQSCKRQKRIWNDRRGVAFECVRP